MRFQQYLNEGRTKQIDLNQTVELTVKNCKNNFKKLFMNKGFQIYRGLRRYNEYGLVDSNQGSMRQSANTGNYTTWLIDNLPSWKGWPKRGRGIICSTDLGYATGYGGVNYVIPYDNSLIGVCPTEDIFRSFRFLEPKYVSNFNNWWENRFSQFQIPTPTSWAEFKEAIIEIYNQMKDKDDGNGGAYAWFDEFEILNPKKKVMDTLNHKMSPTQNGFKMGINKLSGQKEVWIQGKVILVKRQLRNEYIETVNNEI